MNKREMVSEDLIPTFGEGALAVMTFDGDLGWCEGDVGLGGGDDGFVAVGASFAPAV